MPGILSSSWANWFTELSGNRIDFSNTFNVITGNKPINYTTKQKLDRAYIWAAIVGGAAIGGFLESCLVNSESNAPFALAIALGIGLGGYLAHEQVIRPKIRQREKLKSEIEDLKTEVDDKLSVLCAKCGDVNPVALQETIKAVCEEICTLTRATESASNATWTLIARKRGIINLVDTLSNQISNSVNKEDVAAFWAGDVTDLLEEFITPKIRESNISVMALI